jgi:hypothetical protein
MSTEIERRRKSLARDRSGRPLISAGDLTRTSAPFIAAWLAACTQPEEVPPKLQLVNQDAEAISSGDLLAIERLDMERSGTTVCVTAELRNRSKTRDLYVVSTVQYFEYPQEQEKLVLVFSDEEPDGPIQLIGYPTDEPLPKMRKLTRGGHMFLHSSLDGRARAGRSTQVAVPFRTVGDAREVELRVAFLTYRVVMEPFETREAFRSRFLGLRHLAIMKVQVND